MDSPLAICSFALFRALYRGYLFPKNGFFKRCSLRAHAGVHPPHPSILYSTKKSPTYFHLELRVAWTFWLAAFAPRCCWHALPAKAKILLGSTSGQLVQRREHKSAQVEQKSEEEKSQRRTRAENRAKTEFSRIIRNRLIMLFENWEKHMSFRGNPQLTSSKRICSGLRKETCSLTRRKLEFEVNGIKKI